MLQVIGVFSYNTLRLAGNDMVRRKLFEKIATQGADPIAEWSNSLDRGRGDPGSNPASARWRTKYTPYCLCIFVISNQGTVPLIGPGYRALYNACRSWVIFFGKQQLVHGTD